MPYDHFEHNHSVIDEFTFTLENDIRKNNLPCDKENYFADCGYGHLINPGGFNHSPESIKYMKLMIVDLKRLSSALRAYNYYVCGITNEKDFLNNVSKLYK